MSNRNVTAGFGTAMQDSVVRWEWIVKLEFDSGDVRLWSGLGPLTFNAESYTGAGDIMGVGDIEEAQEVQATGLVLSLSGVPSALISLALNEAYQGRPGALWLAAFDSDWSLIADPYRIRKGEMDVIEHTDHGETADFVLSLESRLIDLQRGRPRYYTDEDQKAVYPDDRGLEFVTAIQDVEIIWGRS